MSYLKASYFFRLDLDNTVLVNPVAATSICATDQLRVTATNSQTATFPINPPVLCGTLSGTHSKLLSKSVFKYYGSGLAKLWLIP